MPTLICCNTILSNENKENHPLLPVEIYQYIGTFLGETKPQSIGEFNSYIEQLGKTTPVQSFESIAAFALRFDIVDYFSTWNIDWTQYTQTLVLYQPRQCLIHLLPSVSVIQTCFFSYLYIGALIARNRELLMILNQIVYDEWSRTTHAPIFIYGGDVLPQAIDAGNIENLALVLDALKKLSTRSYFEKQQDIVDHAASIENFDILRFLIRSKFNHLENVSLQAAREGSLSLLEFVIREKLPRHDQCCYEAARRGHLNCLRRMLQVGFRVTGETIFSQTAENGHTHCLKLIVKYYRYGEYNACDRTVRNGKIECLRVLIANNFPRNGNECETAIEYAQPWCLELLFKHNFPIDVVKCRRMVSSNYQTTSKSINERRKKCSDLLWKHYPSTIDV